ncbi:FkbM family methyltransferase [Polynucleobacter paneuropaeus]|jgi:FkbM family methyltransferase|nr:FkbM family methyltransferase [Polynucleobacter paneuropaeus]
MIEDEIKFISTIEHINSENFDQLIKRGDAFLVHESEALTALNELSLNYVAVLITESSELILKVKNLPWVIAIKVDLSVNRLFIEADGKNLITSDIDSISNIFREEFRILLSLWNIDFDAAENRLGIFINEKKNKISKQGGVFIFGTGTIGQQVLQECKIGSVKVLGFIDNDINKIGGDIAGIKINSLCELNPHENIVVIATGKSAEEIRCQLKAADFKNILNLSEFFYLIGSRVEPEINYLNDLRENKFEWLKFSLGLYDEESMSVLRAVLQHRLTLDTQYLAAVHDKNKNQWFDENLIAKNNEAVFVDCGAYDGDTAEAFYKFNGGAKKIHAFEIDEDIANRAKKRLSSIECAVVHSCGVADKKGALSFSKTGITQGRLEIQSPMSTEVQVDSIDNVINEKITYLKFDVEGAEEMALDGAKNQIKKNHPALGLAVYHKAEDIWKVAKQVSEINPNYRFYLRHYTDVSFETVLYGLVK